MTFADEWRQEHRVAVAHLKFSEALDEYLDMRARGANDSAGYTDKNYHYRMEALRERLDALAPVTPGPRLAQTPAPSTASRAGDRGFRP